MDQDQGLSKVRLTSVSALNALAAKSESIIGLQLGAWASFSTSDAPFHGPIGKFLDNLILDDLPLGSSSRDAERSFFVTLVGPHSNIDSNDTTSDPGCN